MFQKRVPSLQWTRSFASYTEVVPPLGDSISEGTVVEWTKSVGDYVNVDDVICVLETDKVSVDIRASQAGTLTAQKAEEGDTVEVGALLADLDTSGAPAAETAPAAAHVATETPAAAPAAAPTPSQPKPAAPAPPKPKPAVPTKPDAGVNVLGSREDVRVPMTRMRQTISKRMKEAQNTAALLTTFNEIDMTNIMNLRKKYKDEFAETHGAKLGFMSLFVKASTNALQKYPDVNAVIDGKEMIYRNYNDISVAVATPTGLVVPVLRNAEKMTFAGVESEIAALGKKAREGRIALEDMAGGTFTISNGGVYGSLMGTPILNMPQSAILGMHGIHKRPIAVGDKVEIRPMMYVGLTYDHRIIDGGTAVQFLKSIKNGVEDPSRLLFEI